MNIKLLFFLCQISRTDAFHTEKKKNEIRLQAETHPIISTQWVYFKGILPVEFLSLEILQYATQWSKEQVLKNWWILLTYTAFLAQVVGY